MNPPKRLAVAAHPKLPGAVAEARRIARQLSELLGYKILPTLLYDADLAARITAREVDVLIAVGGDGTMLRATRLCAPAGVPVLGVNSGHFGFLMEINRGESTRLLPRLLAGDYWTENRMMLHAVHERDSNFLESFEVINEVVVCRGRIVRPIRLKASVDGALLTDYVADGLIAATATGSTAYALAAGGPIMPPELRNILIMPVAPHLSVDRAIILAEGASVNIQVDTDHEAVFSVDGQPPVSMQTGDGVRVTAGENTSQFVRFQDRGYFYRNITKYMEQNPSARISS